MRSFIFYSTQNPELIELRLRKLFDSGSKLQLRLLNLFDLDFKFKTGNNPTSSVTFKDFWLWLRK